MAASYDEAMPSRYIEKLYDDESFYHIFNRGVEKRDVFMDEDDYKYFLGLLSRYMSKGKKKDGSGRLLPDYSEQIELVAYCLMPNHFHMLLYQHDKESIERLMRSVSTAYSMYFNRKYKRVGKLFQGRYKAVYVNEDSYFTHISRYIHLNPLDIGADYKSYPYSSYSNWVDGDVTPWLNPKRALDEFSSGEDYAKFVSEYETVKAELDMIKSMLKEE